MPSDDNLGLEMPDGRPSCRVNPVTIRLAEAYVADQGKQLTDSNVDEAVKEVLVRLREEESEAGFGGPGERAPFAVQV